MSNAKTIETPCANCNGTGKVMHYSHIANGICFHCCGTGTITVDAQAFKADAEKQAWYRILDMVEMTVSGQWATPEQIATDLHGLNDSAMARRFVKNLAAMGPAFAGLMKEVCKAGAR